MDENDDLLADLEEPGQAAELAALDLLSGVEAEDSQVDFDLFAELAAPAPRLDWGWTHQLSFPKEHLGVLHVTRLEGQGDVMESQFGVGKVADRSYAQLCVFAAQGRAAIAAKRHEQRLHQSATAAQQFAEQHNEAKIGRAPELKIVQKRARFELVSMASKVRKRRVLNALDLCRIGFDKRRNRAADSDAYMVSKVTVLRGLVLLCHTVLEQQLAMMRDFASWVVAHKPDAAAAGLCWDETLRTVPKSIEKWCCRQCVIDYVQDILLASRHRIMLHEGMMWACADSKAPSLIPVQGDAHLANAKLHYHHYNKEQERQQQQEGSKPVYTEMMLCQNHQTNLIVMEGINVTPRAPDVGGRLIQNLYASTLFLRMGGHFLRILGPLKSKLEDPSFFTWVPNPTAEQSAQSRAFCAETAMFLVDNLKHHQRQMAPGSAGIGNWTEEAQNIVTCFRTILNGNPWNRAGLTHICINGCCNCRKSAEMKVLWAVAKVVFRNTPTLPLTADWTKLGPSLDWYFAADFSGLLTNLARFAGQWAGQLEQRASSSSAAAEQDDAAAIAETIDFHTLAGKRYKRMVQMLQSPSERFQRVLLCITLEPLRHMHSTFLKFAHSAPDDEAWPLLMQELRLKSSKVVCVLQYLATLLCGKGSRMVTFQQPGLALAVRARLLLIAGSLDRRHACNVDRQPFKLYSLADARISPAEHESTISQFWKTKPCCLPAGFARELRKTTTEDQFKDDLPAFRWMLLMSALITKMSIAGVERRHAVHKQQANPGKPFHYFTADSVLAESRHQLMALDRLKEEREQRARAAAAAAAAPKPRALLNCSAAAPRQGSGPSAVVALPQRKRRTASKEPAPKSGEPAPKRAKGQSALEIFKNQWMRENSQIISKASWDECKRVFDQLPDARKEEYRVLSEVSKVQARVKRQFQHLAAQGEAPAASTAAQLAASASSQPASVAAANIGQVHGQNQVEDNLDRMNTQAASGAAASDVLRRPPLHRNMACQELTRPLLQQATQGSRPTKFPIQPKPLDEKINVRNFNSRPVEIQFARDACYFAKGESVPDKVVYPPCCGHLCKNANTTRVINFHGKVIRLLQDVVQAYDVAPKLISTAGIIFAAERYTQSGQDAPENLSFWAITGAAGRQANHPAQVTLAELRPCAGHHSVAQRR
ncbi:unnamed protein product [Symbiodinium sp. CCMP2592]|nr:unnamed protein product [Symbiodinium sp. CCMP2592]